MKTLYESILSSTGSGMTATVLNNFAKYFKDMLADRDSGVSGINVWDVYVPGDKFSSHTTRLNNVIRLWFPRSKHRTRTTQVPKILNKSGYKPIYEVDSHFCSYDFSMSKVKPFIYYRKFENHLNIYWDNIVFKIGEVNVVFVFVKQPQSGHTVLYVYALNPDGTESETTMNQIKKLIPQK